MPDVAFFKEHVAVGQHDDYGGNKNHQRFNAFGCLRHRNLFLHEIHKKVKDYA